MSAAHEPSPFHSCPLQFGIHVSVTLVGPVWATDTDEASPPTHKGMTDVDGGLDDWVVGCCEGKVVRLEGDADGIAVSVPGRNEGDEEGTVVGLLEETGAANGSGVGRNILVGLEEGVTVGRDEGMKEGAAVG